MLVNVGGSPHHEMEGEKRELAREKRELAREKRELASVSRGVRSETVRYGKQRVTED